MSIPRNEYPRPQLVRNNWLCLNGEWDFAIDDNQALDAGFPLKINVPFCPESCLSGIGKTDFMTAVRYRRTFSIPEEWSGKRILLHFGAVDYEASVFVNTTSVGTHIGGYTPFCFDITDALISGENVITLFVKDDTRSNKQPTGKQSEKPESHGCYYTRTTGIWQTVWLEPVEKCYIKSVNYVSDISAPSVSVNVKLAGDYLGKKLRVKTTYDGRPTGQAEADCTGGYMEINIPLTEKQLWSAGDGRLYDTEIVIADGNKTLDAVNSYFGLRDVGLTKKAFLLNGKAVFGRWVLDQGFYPDGIYTAPTDEALKNDIIYSMQLGFNGARLHEKIFEPRFLYWADKLGYLVWGEYPNWGLALDSCDFIDNILPEWLEELERDAAHPSIIGWCPFNETWNYRHNTVVKLVYLATKAADPTRPVIDTSGNYHTITDIFDVHDYEQDPDKFASCYTEIKKGIIRDQIYRKEGESAQKPCGEPVFMSEYGGILWSDANAGTNGWGYGNGPKTKEEFLDRYKRLTEAMLFNEDIMAFCYTQLYDVEQEQNGLMTYDRKFKFAPEIIKAINMQKAEIEKE